MRTLRQAWILSPYFCALIFSVCASIEAQAKVEPTPGSSRGEMATESLAGVIQSVHKSVNRIDPSKHLAPLSIGDGLQPGEKIRVSRGGILQLRTRASCTAVLYGPGVITAPSDGGAWHVQGSSFRWICPDGQRDLIQFRAVPIPVEVASAEMLYHSRRILVLRGDITVADQPAFLSGHVYERERRSWKDRTTTMTLQEIDALNQEAPPPPESHPLEAPGRTPPLPSPSPSPTLSPSASPAPDSTRLILTPSLGVGRLWHESEPLQSQMNSESRTLSDIRGRRLQAQFKWREFSLIALIDHRELHSPLSEGASPDWYQDILSLEGGMRLNHDRWWSPYARLGLGFETFHLKVNNPGSTYFLDGKFEQVMVLAAAGLDALYRLPGLRGLGLYTSAELQAGQTLSKGRARTNNPPSALAPPEALAPNGTRRFLAGIWSGGLMFEF